MYSCSREHLIQQRREREREHERGRKHTSLEMQTVQTNQSDHGLPVYKPQLPGEFAPVWGRDIWRFGKLWAGPCPQKEKTFSAGSRNYAAVAASGSYGAEVDSLG